MFNVLCSIIICTTYMHPQMSFQGNHVGKRLVTHITNNSDTMREQVFLKQSAITKLQATSIASVRLQPGVCLHVSLQAGFVGEGLVAVHARIRLFITMCAQV